MVLAENLAFMIATESLFTRYEPNRVEGFSLTPLRAIWYRICQISPRQIARTAGVHPLCKHNALHFIKKDSEHWMALNVLLQTPIYGAWVPFALLIFDGVLSWAEMTTPFRNYMKTCELFVHADYFPCYVISTEANMENSRDTFNLSNKIFIEGIKEMWYSSSYMDHTVYHWVVFLSVSAHLPILPYFRSPSVRCSFLSYSVPSNFLTITSSLWLFLDT